MTIDATILGKARRGKTRPRGFIKWNPQAKTEMLLTQIEQILAEYDAHLPLTCRQIFYRLVGAHDYPKTERGYGNLCEALNRARRARHISMSAIRDDGGAHVEPVAYDGVKGFLDGVRRIAEHYRCDRSEGQKTGLMIYCEAAGMVPQLARVADGYGIPVLSSGGFDSLTEKYQLAVEISGGDRPVEILHVGDHDPSGVHMSLSLTEDVEAFTRALGGEVEFHRLAVTPDQIKRLRLPTAPPKAGDKRAFAGRTCQAEAIAPDELARIVEDAIIARMDMPAYERTLRREKKERRQLVGLIERWID